MPLIRSISGLRATIPDCLTSDIVKLYALAFEKCLPEGKIIIGRDGRPSGEWIAEIAADTLANRGREVILLDIVPTPTVQLMVEQMRAAGGISITASHNPSQWNGLKFINSTGVFFDEQENQRLWHLLENQNFEPSVKSYIQTVKFDQAIEKHIDSILNLPIFTKTNILEKLKERNLSVVVDAVNASGSVAIPSLLAKLGCKVHPLYCDSSGLFPHTPEPVPDNLTQLSKQVKELNADLGIAVDPDADRLVLIDNKGIPIGEEKTIALAVEAVLSSKELFTDQNNPKVVVNFSSSRMTDDVASNYGGSVYRSPVGEINVVKLMKRIGAVIGGEGSGGVILPASHYGRDSLVGTALILFLLGKKECSLSEAASLLPHYEIVKLKKEFTGSLSNVIDIISKKFTNTEITFEDGIRIDFPDSWVQLRTSNTEPIIRVIAESHSKADAENLAMMIMDLVK